MSRASPSGSERLQIGDWLVEPQIHRLSRGQQTVRLKPKAMVLLVRLAREPGLPVSKQELVADLWKDAIVSDGALKHLVWELRCALGDEASSPTYIENIPRRGYRLVAPVKELPQRRLGKRSGVGIAALLVLGLAIVLFMSYRKHLVDGIGEPLTSSTKQQQATELFHKGRELDGSRDREANEIAIEYFTRALEIDPELASAKAYLANAYAFRAMKYGFSSEWHERALATARQALLANPDLARAHNAVALIHMARGQTDLARQAFARAADLEEDFAGPRLNLALLAMTEGRWDEGIESLARLARTDRDLALSPLVFFLNELGPMAEADRLHTFFLDENPLHPLIHRILARRELRWGDHHAARERLERILASRPDQHLVLITAGKVALVSGDFDTAERFLRRARGIDHGPEATLLLAEALWLGSRRERGLELMREVEKADLEFLNQGGQRWLPFRRLAVIAALRGQPNRALEYFERAADRGNLMFWYDRADPAFASLRGEQRFEQCLRSMEAKVDAMRRRVIENGWHRQALSYLDPRS